MTADLPAISHLPTEAKRTLLAALARELLVDQRGLVSVADANGEMVVYAVPAMPKAAAEQALREADPLYLDELRRRATDLNESVSLEEAVELQPTRAAYRD
jgi:hypothetical protein